MTQLAYKVTLKRTTQGTGRSPALRHAPCANPRANTDLYTTRACDPTMYRKRRPKDE
jgi:hypothetical protein